MAISSPRDATTVCPLPEDQAREPEASKGRRDPRSSSRRQDQGTTPRSCREFGPQTVPRDRPASAARLMRGCKRPGERRQAGWPKFRNNSRAQKCGAGDHAGSGAANESQAPAKCGRGRQAETQAEQGRHQRRFASSPGPAAGHLTRKEQRIVPMPVHRLEAVGPVISAPKEETGSQVPDRDRILDPVRRDPIKECRSEQESRDPGQSTRCGPHVALDECERFRRK